MTTFCILCHTTSSVSSITSSHRWYSPWQYGQFYHTKLILVLKQQIQLLYRCLNKTPLNSVVATLPPVMCKVAQNLMATILFFSPAISDYKQSLQFQNLNEEKQNIHLEVRIRGTSCYRFVCWSQITLSIMSFRLLEVAGESWYRYMIWLLEMLSLSRLVTR